MKKDLNKEIKEKIQKYGKYKIFENNQFINDQLKKKQLVFKDKTMKSIGFKPDLSNPIKNKLIDLFEIENVELFKKKFDEAVSGDGQELLNMLTIWSSSLCALLCFYNIDEKPLLIEINGLTYCFDKVHFEIKNKVVKNPSNIDIALIDHKNKAILFLESKFAEYLNNDQCKISNSYYKYLNNIQDVDLKNKLFNKNDSSIYHYGLKQLLTHYLGLVHFTNDKEYKYHHKDERYSLYEFYSKNPGTKVFLQEIVFNNNEDRKKEYFENLEKIIEILKWNKNVQVLKPTTYQEMLCNYEGINEKILSFYNFK